MAELSVQKSVYDVASWECKRGFTNYICYKYFSRQLQHEETVACWRDSFGLKNMEQKSNFNVAEISRQESICGSVNGKSKKGCSGFRLSIIFPTSIGIKTQKWLFATPSMRNQRGNRGVVYSSVSPPILTMCDSTHFCFCALPGLLRYWEVSNNPKTTTTTLEDWHEVVWIAKNWTSYQDGKDWWFCQGF